MPHYDLPCPADHSVPVETPLEFYCSICRTYHKLASNYISSIILNSHGEYLDSIITKLVDNQVRITEIMKKDSDYIPNVTTKNG
jgi:hypothetical protein